MDKNRLGELRKDANAVRLEILALTGDLEGDTLDLAEAAIEVLAEFEGALAQIHRDAD
jgi:hypothetical protein